MTTLAVSFALINIVSFAAPPVSPNDFINWGTPSGISVSFDCAARKYAYQYGQEMQPRHGSFGTLFDALQLHACNMTKPNEKQVWNPPILDDFETADCIYYIDATNGNDNNDGSINKPFQTIEKGLITTRSNRTPPTQTCILNLRKGIFYVSEPVTITKDDSYLIIQNYNGEMVTISGGVALKYDASQWKPYGLFDALDWKIHNNSNNCWGRSGTTTSNDLIMWINTYQTLNECINAIKQSKVKFYSFCWNDPSIGHPYGGQCYGIKDESWQPYQENKTYSGKLEGRNIWSVKIQNVDEINNDIPGLRINGKRGIKARYPDQIPEIAMQFDPISGWIPYSTTWKPPNSYPAPKNVIYTANDYKNENVEWPMVTPGYNKTNQYTGMGDWGEYHIGVGGTCNQEGIVPNYGYWCSSNSPRGAGYQHKSPSGITLQSQQILPNAPYSNITGAIFHVWRPGHWFTMMWTVNDTKYYDPSTGKVEFTRGGFQGGEGIGTGAEWYIENVMEELTIPNEYFYNTSTNTLYFYYNNTEINNGSTNVPPPNDIELVATKTKILFDITNGTKNVTIQGFILRDTAMTYLDDHGMPSGGDWALQPQGAITMTGTENVLINASLFTRIDGNGVFIHGYNRYVTISNNDFEWIGDTAIASWGYTSSPDNNPLIPGAGPNGRNGNQPRFNHINNNLVREIGLFQKQSSMYFQAVSCQSIIENNIFFNGPRAAINFNDGFGGDNHLRYNLLINAVRESGDHGPFNSWDRIPFITTIATGEPSIIPAYNQIYQNFIIGTYETQEAIDNDDGSAMYKTYNNFFVYGSNGLKSDFNGNHNHHYGNIYAYINNCYGSGAYDEFHNNSAILRGTGGYSSTCNNIPGFAAYGNALYNKNGSLNVCGMTLQEWVSKGNDPGTTIAKWPTDQEIIDMAKKILPHSP